MSNHASQKRPQGRPYQRNVGETGTDQELFGQDFEASGGNDHGVTLFQMMLQPRKAVAVENRLGLRK